MLARTYSEGGVPVFHGTDIEVIQSEAPVGVSTHPRPFFGATIFRIQQEIYTIDRFICHGAEGQAYSVTQTSTGKQFAAKFCINKNSSEVKLLQQMPRRLVHHPNFLTYEMLILDVSDKFRPAHHIILMEHIPNGELFDLIGCPAKTSEGTSRRFIHDIINGMAECYRHGVTHRDLKPENLLINERGSIIIIDLGHAKRSEGLARTTTVNQYGTVAFNAPEASKRKEYDCELADVWSLGIIAFMLHSKLPPFSNASGVGQFADCSGPDNEPFWRKINSSGWYPAFPETLVNFVNALWRDDPADRPTFEQLESAIRGDPAIISEFPGLAWLAQPVNCSSDFMDELRESCPGKTFSIDEVVERPCALDSSEEIQQPEGVHQHNSRDDKQPLVHTDPPARQPKRW